GLRHRGAGDALHGEPDLVRLSERAGDDDLPAHRLRLPGRHPRVGDAPLGAGHATARIWCMSVRRMKLRGSTDLPVLLTPKPPAPLGAPRLKLGHGLFLVAVLLASAGFAEAQGNGEARRSALAALLDWAPLLLEGFV